MLKRIFTWWNGATVGTWFHTKRNGKRIGADDHGNSYYFNPADGSRWVVFARVSEPTLIPVDWYAWLHNLSDEPPSAPILGLGAGSDTVPMRAPNLSGTAYARVPEGSLRAGGQRSRVSADYAPWTPDQ